ncbi:MAG: 6-phosphofructokinase [Eubacteriaceae bacterium]|nr:6-phosphofructokinase [Eubacteriaceae bacterium]
MAQLERIRGACLIAQSGGPTPVINSSLYGIIKAASRHSEVTEIYGALHGVSGILRDELVDLRMITPRDTELLRTTPSSALGSCRYKMPEPEYDDTDFRRILEVFKKHNIRFFFYNGGNDSMDTCNKISRFMKNSGYDCRVMGIPKTIDNDIYGTDHCPGYGSAAKYVATTMMELYRDVIVYDYPQILIVEVMGRNAGWLTGASALASAYGKGPDLIYMPEVPFDIELFLKTLEKRTRLGQSVIAAVSEGIRDKDGIFISEYGSLDSPSVRDMFGNIQLGGVGATLEQIVRRRLKVKLRSIELSTLQRCASTLISATDRAEAQMVAERAVEAVVAGENDCLVGIKRLPGEDYRVETQLIPLREAANFEKKVPDEYLGDDGHSVTKAFIDYASPLIAGEVEIPRENGLPLFADLSYLKCVE